MNLKKTKSSKKIVLKITMSMTPMSQTGIFHVLFALFFLKLTILIIQGLILSNITCSFQTISPAHSVQQITENVCIESHNVANTTFILQRATRFKTRRNTSSIV